MPASELVLVRVTHIIDFRLGCGRARIADLRRRLQLARRLSIIRHQHRILRELRDSEQYVTLRKARSVRISMTTFNLNAFEQEQCPIDLRFRRNEIGRIAQLIGWDGSGRKGKGTGVPESLPHAFYYADWQARAAIVTSRRCLECTPRHSVKYFGRCVDVILRETFEAHHFPPRRFDERTSRNVRRVYTQAW